MRSWEGRSDMVVEWARVTVVVVLFLMIESSSSGTHDELRMGFYAQSCPKAELIARNSLRRALFTDPTAPAALLRVVFHDCQVEVGFLASLWLLCSSMSSELIHDA